MAHIVAITLKKGGVGKTTTTANLGAALALRGKRVLLIDSDAQANLSILFLGTVAAERIAAGLYEVYTDQIPLTDVIIPIPDYRCLHLVPATKALDNVDTALSSAPGRELTLREKLNDIVDNYDWILIDCPPSTTTLTQNALTASNWYILPIATEILAWEGSDKLTDTIKLIQRRVNPSLQLLAVLPTMYDSRTLHGREILQSLQAKHGHFVSAPIPHTVKFPDSIVTQKPLVALDPKHPGALAYEELADEVISRAS